MSGHNKWSSIKHKKGAADAARGRLFTRIIREVTVAARMGGPDAATNPRLRLAVQKAKAASMPNDTLNRAIKRGSGEEGGAQFEELVYEGYGPAGVAVLAEVMTDNRNRTAAEIRKLFSKFGGNMGESGSVAWTFKKRGYFGIESGLYGEDEIMEKALDAGALDVVADGEGGWSVYTEPGDFEAAKEKLDALGVKYTAAEVTMVPQNTVRVEGDDAVRMLKMMESLEEHDDVQNVYANFDIPREILEANS